MASSLVPSYEVKLLLIASAVIGPDNELKDEVLLAFGFPTNVKKTKMNVQFVDTKTRNVYKDGWNLRIRKLENKKKLELTYKKRYLLPDADFGVAESNANIDEALKTAQLDGFDTTRPYEAQVDVGYRKQTLSISHDEKISDDRFKEEIKLPQVEDSRHFLADNAPKEFKVWASKNLGSEHLPETIIYGPVLAERLEAIWNEVELSIEVWPIQKSQTDPTLEPIVEASFKTPDPKKALEGRAKLKGVLETNGWFLAKDSLRTRLIMERYGKTAMDLDPTP